MQAALYQRFTTVDYVCHGLIEETNKRLEQAKMTTRVSFVIGCHAPLPLLVFNGPEDELAKAKQVVKTSVGFFKKIADDFAGNNHA